VELPRDHAEQQAQAGDADWIQGKIDFHQDGCTVATLFFADGTIRAQPNPNDPTSFG
jgi:hypothetical protein